MEDVAYDKTVQVMYFIPALNLFDVDMYVKFDALSLTFGCQWILTIV